jgi:regulator of protease activity HflC (stomatin/prohibitin superfamily)
MQSESALRALASTYPYDTHGDEDISLSTHTDVVSASLQTALTERLAKAGVEVMEARISHLAYSPEIAAAMLQRQQASAVVAARQTIVEGAVGMVEMALAMLTAQDIVTFDEERKAAMVSNLLVVLCSDRSVTPVVNTGSIHH